MLKASDLHLFRKFTLALILLFFNAPVLAFDAGALREADVSLSSSSAYSRLNQINIRNVRDLEEVWRFNINPPSSLNDVLEAAPIYTGSLVIIPTLNSELIALNPLTGALVWKIKKLPYPVGRRGVLYNQGNIYVPTGSGVYEINADNGKILRVFGSNDSLVAPIIEGDYIYIANNIAGLEKYSIITAKKVWTQKFENQCGAPRVWSGFSFDRSMNQLYVATGNSTKPNNSKKTCLDNSIIAVGAESGAVNWHFQEIEDDRWDLDMVSHPIPMKLLTKSGKYQFCVIAFSKTGSVYLLDAKSGNFMNGDEYNYGGRRVKKVKKSFLVGKLDFDYSDLADPSNAHINSKIPYFSKFSYNPPAYGKPVYFMGIHGGMEWGGASLHIPSNTVVIPTNSYPWVIRKIRATKNPDGLNQLINKKPLVSNRCLVCHANSTLGWAHNEFSRINSGAYISSLLNVASVMNEKNISLVSLKSAHGFVKEEVDSFIDEMQRDKYIKDEHVLLMAMKYISRKSHSEKIENLMFNFYSTYLSPKEEYKADLIRKINDLSNSDFLKVQVEFSTLWDGIDKQDIYSEDFFYQPLTDVNNAPITKPPWGRLTALNLNSHKKNWEIPFGYEVGSKGEMLLGSRNFGGVITTAGGLIFATGTVDNLARAYELESGRVVWEAKLPNSGSTHPMSYQFGGCQYVIFVAAGGRFGWFPSNTGSFLVSYKLKSCN
jgi:glucose dehydrogenase